MVRIFLLWAAFWLCFPGVGRADASLSSRRVVAFEGVADLKARELSLVLGRLPQGALGVRVAAPAQGVFDVHVDVRHVMTPLCDLAAELDGKFEIVGTAHEHRELVGTLSTRYALLNYKPVRDLYLKFSIRRKQLVIDPFLFGVVSGKATINMTGDHLVDAGFDFMSTDLDDVWDIMRARGYQPPPLSGIVTGAVTLKGAFPKLAWSGKLLAYNGRLKRFDYERIDLRFEGQFPVIRLVDGNVVSAQGPRFKVEGVLDLSDLTRMSTQLRQLKRDFVISENDSGRAWTMSHLNDRSEQATQLKSFVGSGLDRRNEGAQAIGLQKQIGF
ncbi:MAG: hypothetical protein V2A70_02105 [Candidatus Omnitrophota bacterium]